MGGISGLQLPSVLGVPTGLPGMNGDPVGNGQVPQTTAPLQQLKMLAQAVQKFGGAGPETGGGGGGTTPGRGPMMLPNAAPPVPQGSMAAGLPQVAGQPNVPGGPAANPGANPVVPQGATPSPAYQSGFQFATPKARNAAVVTNMMQGLADFEAKQQQQKYAKQVEEAKGVVATMLRMGIAADNSQDPDAKKLLQQKANEMLGSKEAAKILKDINKPGTAAYFGAQQAAKDVMAENQQKYAMQELQARMQAEVARTAAEQARAQAEAAREKHEQKLTEQAGTVTPAMKATLDELNKKASMTLEGTKYTADMQYKVGMARVAAIKEQLKDKGDDKILGSLGTEYRNISTQWKNLEKQADDLNKELKDRPFHFFMNPEEVKTQQAKIDGVQGQQKILQQQMDLVKQKTDMLQQHGKITINFDEATQAPPAAAPAASGPTDEEILKMATPQ